MNVRLNQEYKKRTTSIPGIIKVSILIFLLFLNGCQPSIPITSNTIYSTSTTIYTPSYTPTFWSTFIKLTNTPLYIYTQDPQTANPKSSEEIMRRWLNGIPCEPPCWEGVTPGETTYLEAERIWSKNPLFKEVITRSSPSKAIYLTLNTAPFLFTAAAPYELSNLQSHIYLIRVQPFTRFKLIDLINAFGSPSHVIAENRNRLGDIYWFLNMLVSNF